MAPSMRTVVSVSVVGFVVATLAAVACVDDDDGRQACEGLAAKCLPVGRTARCDRTAINRSPAGSAVEDCIQAAPDCDAATECLSALQR